MNTGAFEVEITVEIPTRPERFGVVIATVIYITPSAGILKLESRFQRRMNILSSRKTDPWVPRLPVWEKIYKP